MKTTFLSSKKFRGQVFALAVALVAPALHAQFVSTVVSNVFYPNGLTVDSNGIVYLTESGSNCVVKFTPNTQAHVTLAGLPGVQGTNDGAGTKARFYAPAGIVYAPTLNSLVVVDEGNYTLRLVSLSGVVSTLAGAPGVYGPAVAGPVPAASARFNSPTSVTADTNGNIYIADSGNNAIRLLTTGNMMVSTIQITNYSFYYPEGLSLDDSGNLWVADTKNDTICVISNIAAGGSLGATVIAGAQRQSGSLDDPDDALNSRFLSPGSVYWYSQNGSLLVSDTGNDTIRSIYPTNGGWGTETIAGTALTPGSTDGTPEVALFNQPLQIALDAYDVGLYIVDSGNNEIRDFQPSAPQPPVAAPTFGVVTFPPQGVPPVNLSLFTPASSGVFNNFNPPRIAIEAEAGVETFLSVQQTPTNPLQTLILPGPNTGSPEIYLYDGRPPDQTPLSIVDPSIVGSDITVSAVSQATGRRPSPVVTARFQFVVGNPIIIGDNAASIQVSDITTNSQLFYTFDGSTPVDDGSNTNSFPVLNGAISINLQSNATLSVRGFRAGFLPSGVSSEDLSISNFQANLMTLGFPEGEEASSVFRAAAGQRFYAPVTLTLLPAAAMYSLQFNVTVTNLAGAPAPAASYDFTSMLKLPDTAHPGIYLTIPPEIFSGTPFEYTNGVFTNASAGLLGIGWLERLGATNLYDTLTQDLITFSQAKDDLYRSSAGKVIVGGYSFLVPKTAVPGQTYQLQIGRPSGTADGVGVTPALILAPTNGPLGPGAINAIKNVTVAGAIPYLVGDVNDFRWFNAGDFGDGNLDNSDVEQVFESAVYSLNTPPAGTDMYNAMDSCNGTTDSALFDGNDTTINFITTGDGILSLDDVYVTFRRSLDPTLTWFERYWSNGVLNVQVVPNYSPQPQLRVAPVKTSTTGPHYLTVGLDQVVASGSTATVPLRVLAGDASGYPVRAMMFDAVVDALDGSPPITTPVAFTPAAALGYPASTLSKGPEDFAGVWLNTTNAGVSGAGLLGTFTISLPAGVNANSAYRISLANFAASPNGLGLFKVTTGNGLVTLSDRSASSWGDGISDAWRLVHFGTVSDPNSAATADPDGDGASNWQEYIAGTDPLNSGSVFNLQASPNTGSGVMLQWASVSGKHYTLQSSASPNGPWTTIVTNSAGTGGMMNAADASGAQAKFFRALVQ